MSYGVLYLLNATWVADERWHPMQVDAQRRAEEMNRKGEATSFRVVKIVYTGVSDVVWKDEK